MRRHPDWEARLAAFLEPVRALPFAWGRHDCCTFAAGAVEAMTGEDAMAEFRGHYRTARGSVRALRRYGAGALEPTLTAKFGEPLPPALAQRGDVIMADGALGISLGGFALMVGSEEGREGLIRVPMARWQCAWRVPFGG